MINTANFKTKTMFYQKNNESVEDTWVVALDIGYSSVKVISNNADIVFPSYARKIDSPLLNLGESNKTDIQYRNNRTGELWAVGESAQNMIVTGETRDSITELYGRNRYFSDLFKVISEVGMGVGMIANSYGSPKGKKLLIQTGLPPAYLKSDSSLLKEALAGDHSFSIKIGNSNWVTFDFSLTEEDISIMAQPMGTLFSIATDNKGKTVPEAAKYFKSSVLIFDPGFGTLDVFNIRNRMIDSSETFDNLGMKRVFTETSNSILDKYHQEISVPAMQKYLRTGEIKCRDRKTRSTTMAPFGELLEEANKKVCMEALAKIDNIYNGLYDHDYLVITGGTGAAWEHIIREYYSGMETLKIIMGNQNDNLPCFFSNARGYYLYSVGRLKRKASK